jgi:hypothetical protein
MIGFIGLFDTARDCTLQFIITHTRARARAHTPLSTITSFTSRCPVAAFNGDVSLPLSFQNYPRPQLPASLA